MLLLFNLKGFNFHIPIKPFSSFNLVYLFPYTKRNLQGVLLDLSAVGRFQLAPGVRGVAISVAEHEHHFGVLPARLGLCRGT